jgi:hypothetical protein
MEYLFGKLARKTGSVLTDFKRNLFGEKKLRLARGFKPNTSAFSEQVSIESFHPDH